MRFTEGADYRLSHAAAGYGSYYDQTILGGYFGAMLSEREAPELTSWVRAEAPRRVLDFACGTGRMTRILVGLADEVIGVDVSADMLDRARRAIPEGTFYLRDLTAGGAAEDDAFRRDSFDLVTAFRFFQNAGPELRDEALTALGVVLRPGGVLIMNVQSQAQSPAGRVYGLRARVNRRPLHQLTHAEVTMMLDRHGLAVEETKWYGYFPRPGKLAGRWAAALDRPIERLAQTFRIPSRHVAQMFMVRARLR